MKEHPMVARLDAELTAGGDHPINPAITFAEFKADSFTGEVGKNEDGDLIFHFWPTANDKYNHLEKINDDLTLWKHNEGFTDHLADSFLEVFKLEDKLCWDYAKEMNSWVVRASGFGENLMADELSSRLFNVLQDRLEK